MTSTAINSPDIRTYFQEIQVNCNGIVAESVNADNAAFMAVSRQFRIDLDTWCKVLSDRLETYLLNVAAAEYEFALFALAQGQYRQAFKGLRLVLELSLQSIKLSVDEIALREWLNHKGDTIWSAITNEETGIYSKRFAEAFFADLKPHINNYREMAILVYRECSECVHGNVPKYIPIPKSLAFDKTAFDLWHSKAETVARIVNFSLTLRYLCEQTSDSILILEPLLSERIGHIPEVRVRLGGTR